MNATNGSTRPPGAPEARGQAREVGQHDFELHEIRVQGHLDQRWTDWLDGMTVSHHRDGTTTLTGPLADQAALHGVLNRIRDLALPIVSVRRISPDRQRAIR
jgi:hypothetical protein